MAGGPSHTQVRQVIGTPGYLAPEQLYGSAATPASDLFALGATMYVAVEGTGPFAEVVGRAATAVPRPPRLAGTRLGGLLTRLLATSPLHRPGHGEVMNDLREAAER